MFRRMRLFSKSPKICPDTNVWFRAISGKPGNASSSAIFKADKEDELILLGYIYDELISLTNRPKESRKITREQILEFIKDYGSPVIVENAPPIEYIKTMKICYDEEDAPIVFYCNELGVDVVITYDEDNFMRHPIDLRAKVQFPLDYIKGSDVDRKKR